MRWAPCMKKREARARGLGLAAKITGIAGLALATSAIIEARAAASEPKDETVTDGSGDPVGASTLKVEPRSGNCGCAPCWGPPAPPARGAWS